MYPRCHLVCCNLPRKLNSHSAHSFWVVVVHHSCRLYFSQRKGFGINKWRSIEQIWDSYKLVVIIVTIVIVANFYDTVGFHCLSVDVGKFCSTADFQFGSTAFSFYKKEVFPLFSFQTHGFFQLTLVFGIIELHYRFFRKNLSGSDDCHCPEMVFLKLCLYFLTFFFDNFSCFGIVCQIFKILRKKRGVKCLLRQIAIFLNLDVVLCCISENKLVACVIEKFSV